VTMLAQLTSTVATMSDMIDDLLDLSRSSTAELHLSRLNLGSMAASILDGLAKVSPERQVETIIASECAVDADSGLMHIVLQNLLRNAWKFTGRRAIARIEFGCRRRIRSASRRPAFQAVPEAAWRVRVSRDGHRPGHGAAHCGPARRKGLGRWGSG